MTKNKLVTIPIEEDKRDRLNQYAIERGMKVAEILTSYIDRLLSGEEPLLSTPIPVQANLDLDKLVTTAIQAIKPDLIQEVDDRYSHIIEQLKQHEDDIFDLTNNLLNCQRYIKTLNEQIKSQNIVNLPVEEILSTTLEPQKPLSEPPLSPSHNEMYLHSQLTLEDSRKYIEQRCAYNKACTKKLDRVSNDKIATYLRDNKYPHPDNKQWHRNHIPEVCKLWEIDCK